MVSVNLEGSEPRAHFTVCTIAGAQSVSQRFIDWFISAEQPVDAFDWSWSQWCPGPGPGPGPGSRSSLVDLTVSGFIAVEKTSDDGEMKSFMTWQGLSHHNNTSQACD